MLGESLSMANVFDFHDPRSQDPEVERRKDLDAKTVALRSASIWLGGLCIAFAIMAFVLVIAVFTGHPLR